MALWSNPESERWQKIVVYGNFYFAEESLLLLSLIWRNNTTFTIFPAHFVQNSINKSTYYKQNSWQNLGLFFYENLNFSTSIHVIAMEINAVYYRMPFNGNLWYKRFLTEVLTELSKDIRYFSIHWRYPMGFLGKSSRKFVTYIILFTQREF